MFRRTKVTMRCSVNEPPLIAGKTYRLKRDVADKLILRGYASGELSRVYTGDEANALRGTPQVVRL